MNLQQIENNRLRDARLLDPPKKILDGTTVVGPQTKINQRLVMPETTKPANSKESPTSNGKKNRALRSNRRSKKNPSKAAIAKQRRTPLFPNVAFEEALTIANAIQKFAAGQRVRRLTLFDHLQKSPDSGPSRQLITNSGKYGLTIGGYQSEFLELTTEGRTATSSEVGAREKLKACFDLAIEKILPFSTLYKMQKGNRLPALSILEDAAGECGIPPSDRKEFVEIFIVNAKFLGILRPIAGAERILPIEQVLEESLNTEREVNTANPGFVPTSDGHLVPKPTDAEDWKNVCFYISPIGEEDSENRAHADLFLGSIVEPALEEFGLKVVRADKIGKAGMITAQIIEHILKSRLVIADLSFHNPNVFYELSLRHASRLPTVQIIRKNEKIPFDLDQFRTIQIDTSSIYTLVPNLQTYKAEIATQVRTSLQDPDSVDNPLSTFFPKLQISF